MSTNIQRKNFTELYATHMGHNPPGHNPPGRNPPGQNPPGQSAVDMSELSPVLGKILWLKYLKYFLKY